MKTKKQTTGGAKNFDVLQPGSTVATALSEGEAAPKHAFLLEVRATPPGDGGGGDGDGGGVHSYRLIHLPLRTPRPFAFGDVVLRDALPVLDRGDPRKMVELLDDRVERLIASARSASSALFSAARAPTSPSARAATAPLPPPKLPLVRLRIDYTDVTTLSSAKLAARYVGRVANPGDLFLWHKSRRGLGGRPISVARGPLATITDGGGGDGGAAAAAGPPLQAPPPPAELDDRAIAALVAEHLAAEAAAGASSGAGGGGSFFSLFFVSRSES